MLDLPKVETVVENHGRIAGRKSRRIFAPISYGDKPGGGISAVDLGTGKLRWHMSPITTGCGWEGPCSPVQRTAPTAIPGAVFSASADGHIRAYSTDKATVIWDFDTAPDLNAANGMKARGGVFGLSGQTIGGGMVFVNAGGGYGRAGNALIAFSVDGK